MTSPAAQALRNDSAEAAAHEVEARAVKELSAAASILKSAEPGLAAFFDAFYRGASPEDLTRYTPESLAALASLVFERSAVRKPGETLVTTFEFQAQVAELTRREAVFVAVNDDSPFLFNSLMAEMNAAGARVHALFHPIMFVGRDAEGRRSDTGVQIKESVIVLVLDPMIDAERRAALEDGARNVFRQVRLAVRDWRKMREHLLESIAALKKNPPPVSPEELAESVAFLEWLSNDHFTFLGARDYVYRDVDGGQLVTVEGSGLGVLSDEHAHAIQRGDRHGQLTPEVARVPQTAATAHRHQVEPAFLCAPPRPHGLYRRQTVRRERRFRRRAPFRRPVHVGRL